MKSKWIKTPDGKRIQPQPSRLRLFLQNNTPPPLAIQSLPAIRVQPAVSSARQPDYSTAESDLRRVAGCEITLFGAGSVGSYLGHFMAVGRMTLNVVDCKPVEYKHVQEGRTAYNSTQIGMMKVDALRQKIATDHPGASVRPYPFNVAEITTLDLKDMIERSWIVLLAIDDPEQILRVSDLAYPTVELIQTAMHTQGRTGHIAISMPLITPCLRCTLGISGAQDIRRLDSEPANSLDIITLAQQASRYATDIVYSKVSGQQITRWDISKNLVFLSNRISEFTPAGPGFRYEASQKRPGCPICNPTVPR